jgi:hypothetical protein
VLKRVKAGIETLLRGSGLFSIPHNGKQGREANYSLSVVENVA